MSASASARTSMSRRCLHTGCRGRRRLCEAARNLPAIAPIPSSVGAAGARVNRSAQSRRRRLKPAGSSFAHRPAGAVAGHRLHGHPGCLSCIQLGFRLFRGSNFSFLLWWRRRLLEGRERIGAGQGICSRWCHHPEVLRLGGICLVWRARGIHCPNFQLIHLVLILIQICRVSVQSFERGWDCRSALLLVFAGRMLCSLDWHLRLDCFAAGST
mmetsp:Transcript_132105/g.313117  ORF Transcript_132105/g.313117 Transcript_132105/m.313117 type:complete len:213 (-) Transcript_132105:195-833(-)